uniref:Uncharacterized protein n=1 Tax=Populus trichocarpa TaxID=3694 RepID=A0A2K1R7U4_POPTR
MILAFFFSVVFVRFCCVIAHSDFLHLDCLLWPWTVCCFRFQFSSSFFSSIDVRGFPGIIFIVFFPLLLSFLPSSHSCLLLH